MDWKFQDFLSGPGVSEPGRTIRMRPAPFVIVSEWDTGPEDFKNSVHHREN